MNENRDGLFLTSSRAARLLGVHSSTIKRWCDDGGLSAERTHGGHRRIHLQEALSTSRDQGLSTFLDVFRPWEANVWLAVSEIEERRDFRRLINLSLGWLSAGETERLARLLFEVGIRPGIPFDLFLDDGLRSFMARVGEEWRGGRLAVGEEHMATQVVLEVLLKLRPAWGGPEANGTELSETRPTAVVGVAEGDTHELGAQAVRVLLEREGWRVYYLGANLPAEEFAAIQRAQGAELVCLSFPSSSTAPDLHKAIGILTESYRPDHPYSLCLGGGIHHIPEDMVPEGPFLTRAISTSTGDFLAWVRALHSGSDAQTSRRVA